MVEEKTVTLVLAEKTAKRLEADGIGVILSRYDDSLPGALPDDYADNGQTLTPSGLLADLQRRIDRADASGARAFLSIHMNIYSDPAIAGSEVFYDSARPFGSRNAQFADLIQGSLIQYLRSAGYSTPDRGTADDQDVAMASFGTLGSYNHLVVLGPGIAGQLRPTSMPGALSEPFFLSNPPEATAALQPETQDLLAQAYAAAIEQFLHVGAHASSAA
jgi:N-acetylmuramoyl-L-alanine amidase